MTETPTDDAEDNDSLTPQILKAQKQVEEAKQRYKISASASGRRQKETCGSTPENLG
ncbi:hypothetical protein [Zymomonas mobilis]|uniref:hypothetical protein n=1 Tax=Zymomonas mobilis TaxID=542 RepID=UPI00208DCA36|nr:hypothetical protein [Zymomonas mobilis]